MSAIAAVHRRDGVTVNDADGLARVANAAPHRDASPACLRIDGAAALACAGGRPSDDSRSRTAVVFDGRLDNADDLSRALGAPLHGGDAAVVLAAYARWGCEAFARLVGDFALAIADARTRRLVCARDAMGQRPLFYWTRNGVTVAASDVAQVLAHPLVDAVVNEGMAAEHLTGMPVTVDETLWRGVMRLPRAHALVADAAGVRTFRYWDFDPAAHIHGRSDDEYAEQFRDLFSAAVACRVRDARRVAVFLSGGIDSSAVAGVASAMVPAGVRALSLAFPGEPCDESAYVDAVASAHGLALEKETVRPVPRAVFVERIRRSRDVPPEPNGAILDPLRRKAKDRGVDVVLTGYGGDDCFTGSPSHTADLLRDGRLVAAALQWTRDGGLPGRGYRYAQLARTAVAPLLPAALKTALRPIAGSPPPRYEWIREEFAERVALSDRRRERDGPEFPTLVQRDMYRLLHGAVQAIGDEQEDRAAHAAGVDQRHPFYDRRVAEFGLALPESQRWKGSETKVVVRRALGGVLPPLVRKRNDKAEFSSTYVRTLEAIDARALLERPRTEAAGWVDAAATRRLYDDMLRLYNRGDEAYIRLAGAVWSVVAMELWLEHGL